MNEKFALFVGTVVTVMAAVWFLTYLAERFRTDMAFGYYQPWILPPLIIGVTLVWWQWVKRR